MDCLAITIKYGKEDLAVETTSTAKIAALKEQLEALTGVFVRKQKLIFKGKVLDDHSTLVSYKITPGSKLMLMETGGPAAKPSNGGSSIRRGGPVATSLQELLQQRTGQTTATKHQAPAPPAADPMERKKTWQKTGVIALRDLALQQLPAALLQDLPAARLADISHNLLTALPASLSALASLQSLKLSSNRLTDDGLPWQALAQLNSLQVLLLDGNSLGCVPACVGELRSLAQLNLSRNGIQSLPAEVSGLQGLQVLHMAHNQLASLPAELSACTQLLEIEASHNQITSIPETYSQLPMLQSLRLNSNRIKQIPSSILTDCTSLRAIALHDNPITADQLRSTPGFEQYEQRRRAKCDKQLESSVMLDLDRSFTEGADQQQWQHWG